MAVIKAKSGEQENAFKPTAPEIAISLGIALLTLMAANFFKLLDFYKNSARVVGFQESAFKFEFIKSLNPRLIPTIETFMIWSLIGLLFYLTIWFIFSVLGEAGHDAGVVHGFMFPEKNGRSHYALAILKRFSIRLVGMVASILWLIFLFNKVLPYCSVYFYQVFTYNQTFDTIWKAIVSLISLGMYFFILAPMLRMVVLKPRLFNNW